MAKEAFAQWGWRIPFLVSLVLADLLDLHPAQAGRVAGVQEDQERREDVQGAADRELRQLEQRQDRRCWRCSARRPVRAWSGTPGQFYALFFLIITLKLDFQTAYILIAISLVIGTPFFIFFGWLSDRIGRKNIIMAGCLLAVLTYFPLFKGLTHYVNPDLEAASAKTQVHRGRQRLHPSTSSSVPGRSSATATRPRTS